MPIAHITSTRLVKLRKPQWWNMGIFTATKFETRTKIKMKYYEQERQNFEYQGYNPKRIALEHSHVYLSGYFVDSRLSAIQNSQVSSEKT